ncbi:MAG: phosphate ABC transporter permease PstA [candidate division Zixibacteria bacterium]|nr:phosphate ABC transporter permease PstA [candidate division Zixibacteria bacterium]
MRFRINLIGSFFTGLTLLATLIIFAILFVIIGNVVLHGHKIINWEFITQAPREGMTAGGIFPAIFGTVALVILMIIAVLPVGVMTAIYLHEYAKPESVLTRTIRFAVNNLAGVPSIVFGLFGLGFFIQFIGAGMDKFSGLEVIWGQPCLLWAALTLALLNLPVVVVAAEEALRAVPKETREASLALGATKWQTIRRVVLPQALPGVLTGAILSISRGAGEVAPIMFTGAAYFLPYLPHKPTDQFMELGYHVYVMATQSPDVEATKPILYGTVLVLLILTLLLNFIAIFIRSKVRRQMRQTI